MLAAASKPLKIWVSEAPAVVEDVLRIASLARTNDFELMNAEGWTMLREEICKDFPTLTISELGEIMKLGIKGKIETPYKSSSLNFTRIYQWVEVEVEAILARRKQGPPQPLTDDEKERQRRAIAAHNAQQPIR